MFKLYQKAIIQSSIDNMLNPLAFFDWGLSLLSYFYIAVLISILGYFSFWKQVSFLSFFSGDLGSSSSQKSETRLPFFFLETIFFRLPSAEVFLVRDTALRSYYLF